MLTIGDKFPSFRLQSVVSTEKGKEFKEISDTDYAKKMEGRILLAQGLHFRLPDRDRRVR